MALECIVGFLGFGNMGAAIAKGLVRSNTLTPAQVVIFDVDEGKRAEAKAIGATIADSPADLARRSTAILLAVKPQTMEAALEELKPGFSDDKLIISIAAGISTQYLRDRLGASVRVVRVMPNTPAMIGQGAAGIAPGTGCTEDDARIAQTIFDAVGITELVKESDMDVVTALSGSGPAYFFYIVECLIRAAEAHGLTTDQARRLASQTMLGASRLLQESDESAEVLRQRVTSKGGTTAAALEQLFAADLDATIRKAVDAAAARSKELGK